VGLVAVILSPQHRLAVSQPKHGGHRLGAGAQVVGEGVLGGELSGGTDADVVALDENGRVTEPNQRGGRHRPRTAPGHHGLAAQASGVAAAQDAAQFVVGQRGPVGFGQVPAQAVNTVRARGQRLRQRSRKPISSVTAAATLKDRIEADIQLAGVKPMSCPIDVHAEAHQDTYPGLMSW